jgi:hypothetical protein
VTARWQTSFVPPDPKSDSLVLLDERLAAGQHAIHHCSVAMLKA